MLSNQGLYFSRVDRLGDPFEGSVTVASTVALREALKDVKERDGMLRRMSELRRTMTRNFAVNCWHMNEHESAAMWRLYSLSDEGVAVRSTVRRLTELFPRSDGVPKPRRSDGRDSEPAIYIGQVNYIDYDSAVMEEGNFFWPVMHKRKAFEHERELRAVTFDIHMKGEAADTDRTPFPNGGVLIPADLSKLVEAVYVTPASPMWFADLVASLTKQYSYGFEVRQSRLAQDPVF